MLFIAMVNRSDADSAASVVAMSRTLKLPALPLSGMPESSSRSASKVSQSGSGDPSSNSTL